MITVISRPEVPKDTVYFIDTSKITYKLPKLGEWANTAYKYEPMSPDELAEFIAWCGVIRNIG